MVDLPELSLLLCLSALAGCAVAGLAGDPIALARALLAAQQGIVFMSRTGLDAATLTATARSPTAQLLPDHSGD